ncbi:MAG: sugar phosphate isomerase/epimerase family protein [Pirellulales bacterium]|nr:sugar phosphate isomerase/epimerase family protein [Pirellulales bacterium]
MLLLPATTMLLGYNTNGLAHHHPADALALLADLGYQAVGITLDHGWLNPYSEYFASDLRQWQTWVQKYQFRTVIETGARFLLNSREKHEPTLVSTDAAARQLRINFYERAIHIATELNSDCVSLWSGVLRESAGDDELISARLVDGLEKVLTTAERYGMPIGFEPEPGMFVESMLQFEELKRRLPHPLLKLTLDIGHLHCLGEVPIADHVRQWQTELVNVHLEDMRAGVHEHLPFGEGEIDFGPVLAALREMNYSNGVYVELSRDSHRAPTVAAAAMDFLRERCSRFEGLKQTLR